MNGSPSAHELCSTVSGEHILPFAHDSSRANYVSKLLDFTNATCTLFRIGAVTDIQETPHVAC